MAHHTRNDIQDLMSGTFTQARCWQLWKPENPMEFVSAGKKETVRSARKLTMRKREICSTPCRPMCASFAHGLILVRQRFYRGDLGETKTPRSRREAPMGQTIVLAFE